MTLGGHDRPLADAGRDRAGAARRRRAPVRQHGGAERAAAAADTTLAAKDHRAPDPADSRSRLTRSRGEIRPLGDRSAPRRRASRAAGPAAGHRPPGAVDKDWVTQMWKISMTDIEAAFRRPKHRTRSRPSCSKTMFLQVEMVREEMVDGKWQDPKVIPHSRPTRNNQPMQPYPGDGPDPRCGRRSSSTPRGRRPTRRTSSSRSSTSPCRARATSGPSRACS